MTPAKVDLTVFINDLHCPYNDVHTQMMVLRFIEDIQPSHIFLNGDMIDFYQLSRFDKNPNRALELQEDIDELVSFLTTLRHVSKNAEIVYTEGNHEHRLYKYLCNHPELFGLKVLQPEKLLCLDQLNIEWVPQEHTYVHHGFVVTHGDVVRKHSGYSAKAMYEKYGTSGISGHTHRVGMYRHRNFGSDCLWIENGCLCELDPDYVVGTADWQQAISVGEFIKNDKRFQITQLQIVNHKMLYRGVLYD